jgi:hypothetical protein
MKFKVRMIRIKGDKKSEAYANYCAESWRGKGFDFRFYDAVTPESLSEQSGITFGKKGNRELTPTEKACFYSQYNLWKKCAVEKIPVLVLEHDAYLENADAIQFNPHLQVQFFGQHAMEAVMYHPRFASRLIHYTAKNEVTGPMSLVDSLLGYFRKTEQSRYGIPHARFQGKYAPVKSVFDPNLGNTIDHKDSLNARIENGDADLFKLVQLEKTNGNPEE